MRIESYPDVEDVARRAADAVAEVVGEKPDATLILPAGSTPVPLYRELVARRSAGLLDLDRVHLFQLDELVGVAASDERSFAGFLDRQLLEPIGRSRSPGVHLLDGDAPDPRLEIERHAAALLARGGADLALLGIGRNGHVAFNEPGSVLADGSRVVELAEVTIDGLRGSFAGGAAPTRGITLGLSEIFASRRLVLVATGPSKTDILASLARVAPTPDLPASLLDAHADFVVLADEPAAARLGDEVANGAPAGA